MYRFPPKARCMTPWPMYWMRRRLSLQARPLHISRRNFFINAGFVSPPVLMKKMILVVLVDIYTHANRLPGNKPHVAIRIIDFFNFIVVVKKNLLCNFVFSPTEFQFSINNDYNNDHKRQMSELERTEHIIRLIS